jgi:PTH1 family peptidyl-tRNA hydrolase
VKYLIAGLGNIGAEYDFTRHNIGFSVVEFMAMKAGVAFTSDRHAHVCEFKMRGRQVTLIKPTTYMNLSGKAVNYWLQALKIPREHLMVVTDDLSLPLGKIRLRQSGSAGGHNGLRNIQEVLGTDQYSRLRFGIGSDFPTGMQVDFVLSRWLKEEEAAVADKIQLSYSAIECFVSQGITATMNAYNNK